jgi:hypothetical protein
MQLDPTGKWILTGRYWVRRSDGLRLPVIQGGGAANTVQNDRYAFGDDDNNEATHTLDTENTNRTAQSPDVTFMIRIQVEETAGGSENKAYALFAQKNAVGGFNEVTTSSTNGIIIANDTQSRADNENTTERLTAGAGTFTAGKYDDGQTQQGTTTIALDAQYTDLEFAIQIDSANANDNDAFELRAEFSTGTDLDGYPGSYPTVTADILETPSPSVSDSVTTGESQTVIVSAPQASASDAVTVSDSVGYYSETYSLASSSRLKWSGEVQ